jgi:hypothetical protein
MCSRAPPEVLAKLRKNDPERADALAFLASVGHTYQPLTTSQWKALLPVKDMKQKPQKMQHCDCEHRQHQH